MRKISIVKEWEKNLVGKNVHSVYVYCFNCRTDGINMPLERDCGKCGSTETTTYYDRETIDNLVTHLAQEVERETREEERKKLKEFSVDMTKFNNEMSIIEVINEVYKQLKLSTLKEEV